MPPASTKPRRPLSAYNLFYLYKRAKIIEANTAVATNNKNGCNSKEEVCALVATPPGLENHSPPSSCDDNNSVATPTSTTTMVVPTDNSTRRQTIRQSLTPHLFAKNTKNRVHSKNTSNGLKMTFVEMNKIMVNSWKLTDDFAKGVFQELADEAREEYQARMSEYNETAEGKRGVKGSGKAKKGKQVGDGGAAERPRVKKPKVVFEPKKVVSAPSVLPPSSSHAKAGEGGTNSGEHIREQGGMNTNTNLEDKVQQKLAAAAGAKARSIITVDGSKVDFSWEPLPFHGQNGQNQHGQQQFNRNAAFSQGFNMPPHSMTPPMSSMPYMPQGQGGLMNHQHPHQLHAKPPMAHPGHGMNSQQRFHMSMMPPSQQGQGRNHHQTPGWMDKSHYYPGIHFPNSMPSSMSQGGNMVRGTQMMGGRGETNSQGMHHMNGGMMPPFTMGHQGGTHSSSQGRTHNRNDMATFMGQQGGTPHSSQGMHHQNDNMATFMGQQQGGVNSQGTQGRDHTNDNNMASHMRGGGTTMQDTHHLMNNQQAHRRVSLTSPGASISSQGSNQGDVLFMRGDSHGSSTQQGTPFSSNMNTTLPGTGTSLSRSIASSIKPPPVYVETSGGGASVVSRNSSSTTRSLQTSVSSDSSSSSPQDFMELIATLDASLKGC